MKGDKKKLLFITHVINDQDNEFSFAILWIKEFIRQGFDVNVICFRKSSFDNSFPVYSLESKPGQNRMISIFRFLKLIMKIRYDSVFVHMNPRFITLGGWLWFLRRKPVYLWYTHYAMHIHVLISAFLCKRMFAATPGSMPQFKTNRKRVITGHGIDFDYWQTMESKSGTKKTNQILCVHRFCRSKRIDLAVKALKGLPDHYNLLAYTRFVPEEKDYHDEVIGLINKENLKERIIFKQPVPMSELKNIYPRHRLMINMASETIDKTMLEAMMAGVYPVTTKNNSIAIGLPVYPKSDTPEDIADFILKKEWEKYDQEYLRNIVVEKHSLRSLVEKIGYYIKQGI